MTAPPLDLDAFRPGWVWTLDGGQYMPEFTRRYLVRTFGGKYVWVMSEVLDDYWMGKI